MNIVIVEDSKLIRTQFVRLLSAESRFKIIGTATEEEEAVNLILSTQPDTVLLDLSLSPGSGVQALRRIREAGCGARVLILTNQTDEALREACEHLGANGYFDKSHEFDACLAQLQSWLPPLPASETRRLEMLYGTHLLDTQEQEAFDNLTHLAAQIADVPIAMISLVAEDRQWFLSHTGTELRETSRTVAFCAHTILQCEMMEVADAREDPRFFDNPLVVGSTQIRFYAGVPLILPSGEALGTLCVVDSTPKQLTDNQRRALKTLASSALAEIELRRRIIHLEQESERRRTAEAHILHLATRDPLTALPNRATFRDRLDQHVRSALRRKTSLGVLFIDLDKFKPINDTLGHDVGDDALVMIAERLHACLRSSDTVARLGGDEFAAVLPDISSSVEAMQVANKVITTLQRPIHVKGHTLYLGASVGVALFPEHGRQGDQLLRHADLAMYHAKQGGGNRVGLYSKALSDRAEELQILDGDLREGLKRDELLLHFQPQVMLGETQLCGVEALVRWNHPRFGILPPNHFVPMAEQRGFINELTRKVLDMALAQLKAWDLAGLKVPRVAVNVSPVEIRANFAEMIESALYRHNIAPDRLELEITESTLTSDGIETMHLLTRLKQLGVGIAVDDFGVGYSSLAQLHRLPIDCLKIDRSFVQDIESSACDLAIVQAVVTMAEALGLRTVVEGVETEGQVAALKKVGCKCAQGFFLSRPLPAQEVERWMRTFIAGDGAA